MRSTLSGRLFHGACACVISVLATGALAEEKDSLHRRHFHPDEIRPMPQTAAGSRPSTRRSGEDWPEFLGPRGTGVSGETGLLDRWPNGGPPVLFKKKLGEGYAAPSVIGNRLVLFHRRANEEIVECLTADEGDWVWRHTDKTDYVDPYGYNNGPRCAPLLTETRCYTCGAEGLLTCLNLEDGEVVWQRNTAVEFRVPRAFFGVGATPILENGLLIVMVGGHPKSGMVAFDAESGKTVWESVSPASFPAAPVRIQRDRPPEKLASYATPLAATIHGKRHLLCFMRPGLVSVDPRTGEEQFSYWFRSQLHDSVNAARPVVVGDEIFLSAAYETGAVLLKVDETGRNVVPVWRDVDAMQTHWSTPIHHHGYLYGFSGRHQLGSTFRCIELHSGKLMWKTEDDGDDDEHSPKVSAGKAASKSYGRGSAILAEGKLYVQGESGVVALVELNPREFREISRVEYPELGYPSWIAPVLSRGRLYLSGSRRVEIGGREGHEYTLYCLDVAAPPDRTK
jgi:outer membrane protein assembly factor BamB